MRILFCNDPLNPKLPDSAYQREVSTAQSLEIAHSLVNFETLVYETDLAKAVRHVLAPPDEELGVYRGWMLKPSQYADLHAALLKRNIRLINSPVAYQHCHYLPESYSKIEGHTPRSIWVPADGDLSTPRLLDLLKPFGSRPVILKDYVKSRKHEWAEACFIPSASDADAVERVVAKFLALQGDDLNVGLVFREFAEFEPLTEHSKSGMPLSKEFRIFFLDGQPIYTARYWDEGDYEGVMPPLEEFREVASGVESRFFTMDVAKRLDGDWTIVELGDAQVAELPDTADAEVFFLALQGCFG